MRKLKTLHLLATVQAVLLLLLRPSLSSEVGTSPQVTLHPTDSVVALGGSTIVQCGVSGSPTPTVTWYKDEDLVSLGGRIGQVDTGSLQISDFQGSDEGKYHCVASNAVGSVLSLSAELQEAYIRTFTTPTTQDISTINNDPLILNCTIPESLPPATALWYYQSEDDPFSDSGGRVGQTLDGRLVFSSYKVGDNGRYTCEVENELITASPIVSSSYRLTSASGTSMAFIETEFAAAPASQDVIVGDTLQLECFTTGIPQADISWEKDSSSLSASGSVSFSQTNHILTITGVSAGDAGTYACVTTQASNSGPRIGRMEAEITVTAPPVIIDMFPETEVFVTQPVSLICKAEGNEPLSWTWRHDTQEVFTSGRVDFTRSGTESTLTITEVQESDGGVYQCEVEEESGRVATSNEQLVAATLAPSFTHGTSLEDVLAFKGSTVVLPCSAIGYPPPNFSWIKSQSDTEIDFDQEVRYSIPPSGTNSGNLTITDTVVGDSGPYECKATNSAAEGGVTTESVFLTILGNPIIISPATSFSIPHPGDTVTLFCSITVTSSTLKPVTYIWSRNGDPLTLGGKISQDSDSGDLTIADIQEPEVGLYECTALLSVQGNTAELTKYIGDVVVTLDDPPVPPSPPLNLSPSSPSPSSFMAMWEAPLLTGGLMLEKYIIEVISLGRPGCSQLDPLWEELPNTVPAGMTEVEIDALTPYFSYKFRVIAVNFGALESETSEESTPVETLESAPSAPPTSVSAASGSEGALQLSWQPPSDCTTHNGDLTGYTLRYREAGGGGGYILVEVTGGEVTTYPLTDLQLQTEYEVQVAAKTSQGVGPYSQVTTETTNPAPPTDVEVEVLNSTAVRVTWKPHGGELMGYIVVVTEGSGGEEVLRQEVGPSAESAVVDVSSLDPEKVVGGLYQYGVIAVDQHGVESVSAVGKITTSAGGSSQKDESTAFYEEIWFIAVVSVVGTLFVVFPLVIVIGCCCFKAKKGEGKIYIPSHQSASGMSGASSGFSEYQHRHNAIAKIVKVHSSPTPSRRTTDYADLESIRSLRSQQVTNASIGYPDSEGSAPQTSGSSNHHNLYRQGREECDHISKTASALDGYDHIPRRMQSPTGPGNDFCLPAPPAFYTPEEEDRQMTNFPRGHSQSQDSEDFWNPAENLNFRGHMSNRDPLSQTTSIHSSVSVSSTEGSSLHDQFRMSTPDPPPHSRSGSRTSSNQSGDLNREQPPVAHGGRFVPAGVVMGGYGSSGHSRQSSIHSRNQLPPLQENEIMEDEGMDVAHSRAANERFQFSSKLPPQRAVSLDRMLEGGGKGGRDMEMQPPYLSQRLEHTAGHRHEHSARTTGMGMEPKHRQSSHGSIPIQHRTRTEQGHHQAFPSINGYPEHNPRSPHAHTNGMDFPDVGGAGSRQSTSQYPPYPHSSINQNYLPPHHASSSQLPPRSSYTHPHLHQSNFPEHRAISLQSMPGYRDRHEPLPSSIHGQTSSQNLDRHHPSLPPPSSQLPPVMHTSLQHLERSRSGNNTQNPNPSLPPQLQHTYSYQHANGPSIHRPNHTSIGKLAQYSDLQRLPQQHLQQRAPENEMPDVVRNSTSPPAYGLRGKPTRMEDLGHLSDIHSRKPQLKKAKVPGQVWVQQPMSSAIQSSSESEGETVLSQSEMGDATSLNSLHV